MMNELKKIVFASELANQLRLQLSGEDCTFFRIDPINQIRSGSLSFLSKERDIVHQPLVLITKQEFNIPNPVTTIISHHPRLDFVKALLWLNEKIGFKIHESEPKIHPSVQIGQFSVIGMGVEIGEGTIIHNHVTIRGGVKIGKNCIIKSGAVIGEDGFGFERDENGVPLRMIHLGNVEIGNNVEIGSVTTVCRGTLSNTIIEDDAKIDDHVHVAHNCIIRRKALVIACAELSGGVEVGEEAWIAPNASVIEQKKIGIKSTIGLGAVVLCDVENNAVMVGNPARKLEKKSNAYYTDPSK